MSNNLLTLIEASEIAMQSPKMMAKKLRDGTYPGRKVGGMWFIDIEELKKAMVSADNQKGGRSAQVVVGSRHRP